MHVTVLNGCNITIRIHASVNLLSGIIETNEWISLNNGAVVTPTTSSYRLQITGSEVLKVLIGVLDAESKRKFSIIASYANFYDDCTVTQTVYDTELALKIDTITSWTFNFQKSILGH